MCMQDCILLVCNTLLLCLIKYIHYNDIHTKINKLDLKDDKYLSIKQNLLLKMHIIKIVKIILNPIQITNNSFVYIFTPDEIMYLQLYNNTNTFYKIMEIVIEIHNIYEQTWYNTVDIYKELNLETKGYNYCLLVSYCEKWVNL